MQNRASGCAARAFPGPVHFEVVDLAPFPIGGRVIRGWSQSVWGYWMPLTRDIDSNPFHTRSCSTTDDVIVKITRQIPSCCTMHCTIEHVNPTSCSKLSRKAADTLKRNAQHHTRQPNANAHTKQAQPRLYPTYCSRINPTHSKDQGMVAPRPIRYRRFHRGLDVRIDEHRESHGWYRSS